MYGNNYPPPESYPSSQPGYPPQPGYGPPPQPGYGPPPQPGYGPQPQQYAQGYALPGAYPSPYPPAGYPQSPYPPTPQQTQAYYAAQGRQLFVQAMLTPAGGYMAAPQPTSVAYPGGDYDKHNKSKHKPNGFTLK